MTPNGPQRLSDPAERGVDSVCERRAAARGVSRTERGGRDHVSDDTEPLLLTMKSVL